MSIQIAFAVAAAVATGPEVLHDALSWRGIGPSRGGRVTTVTGVPGDSSIYYMGAAGGGVWKTTDAGASWRPTSDGSFGTGSVGALAIAPSDHDIIYAGMGERDPRGNFSHGDGMYRSDDAGATWRHIGLADTRQIARVVVDPRDADHVWVAALGHIYGEHDDRGVYETHDGGETWKLRHWVDERTGAIDLEIRPDDPDTIFAAFWQIQRTAWSMDSGGPGSGLYRSTDGGDSWEELTRGLPKGIKGKIGISISPVDPDLVWAMVEAKDGGLFKSTNGGDSWRRVNEDASLRQRAWYYTHVYADTQDVDVVYVLNVGLHKSTDGGREFSWIRAPHVDHHDLWINPDDPLNIINGNDGGANVTFDGGRSWSRQDNQPTAQFYRVTVDTRFPYRVYGAQQDNSTASVSSRSFEYSTRGMYSVGGGESGYIAVHPEDPDIVYAGSYGGYLSSYNHRTGVRRNITVWPENPMGAGVETMKERFQWTFPIVISHHDHDVLYVGGHRVHKSTDEGRSWEAISPDLTTNDKSKQGPSGGPITKDNTSVEYYCTIFTIAESPLEAGVIWAGSDDGLIHVTRDGGESWTNVTPAVAPWSQVSLIDASPHAPGRAFAAVNRYKLDDFAPAIYRTDDYGASWQRINDGIAEDAFVRAVREDPERENLLYAGTETGVYVSYNGGENWHSLQGNLPVVPITDLLVTGGDLVVATQGRSFWILADLELLRQWDPDALEAPLHLYTPRPAQHAFRESVTLRYHLPEARESVTVEILDDDGDVVRSWMPDPAEGDASPERVGTAPGKAGLNTIAWNARHADAEDLPGAVMWGGGTRGPNAGPGAYTVRVTAGDDVVEAPLEIALDPRTGATLADYQAQEALLLDIRDAVTEVHRTIKQARDVRDQVQAVQSRLERARDVDGAAAIEAGKALITALTSVEEALVQTKSKSRQDPLNFPIRLNDKIAALAGTVSQSAGAPTAQSYGVFDDLMGRARVHIERLGELMAEDVPAYNELVRTSELPAVWIDRD